MSLLNAMTNQKSKLSIALVVLLALPSLASANVYRVLDQGKPGQGGKPPAQGGGKGGNGSTDGTDTHGGNADEIDAASAEIEFRNLGLDIYQDLLIWNKDHPGEIDAEKFLAAVRACTLNATVKQLYKIDGKTPADANNHYPAQVIDFNLGSWRGLKNRIIKRKGLVAHEFFGLMGIELDNYRLSAPFKAFLESRGVIDNPAIFSGISVEERSTVWQIPDGTRMITQVPFFIAARSFRVFIQGGRLIQIGDNVDDTKSWCSISFDSTSEARIVSAGHVFVIDSIYDSTGLSVYYNLTNFDKSSDAELRVSRLSCVFKSTAELNFGAFRASTFDGAMGLEIAPPRIIR